MSPRRSAHHLVRPSGLLALAATAAAAVGLAACGSSSGGGSSGYGAASTTASDAAAAPSGYGSSAKKTTAVSSPAGATLSSHQGKLGTFLVDGAGRAVYLFEQDTSTASTCEAACAAAWPPVTAKGKPTVGPGLKQDLVGTTGRADGTTQLTYAGHPLYRFSGDQQPGAATGQGVKAFGAPWYVVRPSGEKLDAD